ncbi:asparaginase [Candidatus Kaiserbacteria bacterium]|nr:asparaginase [Candidatus Kaiserbacteria bacterium]
MNASKNFDVARIVKAYSLRKGKKTKKFSGKKSNKSHILLLGCGGTISSGYTPTYETIVPLHPSPAIKQIDYLNLFKISNIKYDRLDLLAKDSRKIAHADIIELLDLLHRVPNRKILITAGTYMLPKIAKIIALTCKDLKKSIVLTGSILPAGFVASDADANIWSALTVLNHLEAEGLDTKFNVLLVFHGRVFSSVKEFKKLNLHPKAMRKMVIQYPLSSVPVDGVL